MFRCQEFMTQEQQGIAEEFQNAIEAEYALCVREIKRINQAIANNGVHDVASLVYAVTTEPGKNRKKRNAKTYPKEERMAYYTREGYRVIVEG